MLACFMSGCIFTIAVPNTHFVEVESSTGHGEILLVINTHRNNVHAVENIIQRRHPEAIIGGAGWTIEAFH
jgi:hypothetical protein